MYDITVVCYLWRSPNNGDRSYTHEHVNVMYSMLRRHLSLPHQLVCVTDMPEGVRPEVRCVPLDGRLSGEDFSSQRFQKLSFWRRDAAEWLGGERLLLMDLDQVIVDSIDPLVDRPDPLIMWHKWRPKRQRMVYSSSMVLLDSGAHPEVYEKFDPDNVPPEFTGDQAWVIHALEGTPSGWTEDEGIVNFVKHTEMPPQNARVVVLSGGRNPANRREGWIGDHWR